MMIDADAHVIENDATWEYMLEAERRFKPQLVRTGADYLLMGTDYGHSDNASELLALQNLAERRDCDRNHR